MNQFDKFFLRSKQNYVFYLKTIQVFTTLICFMYMLICSLNLQEILFDTKFSMQMFEYKQNLYLVLNYYFLKDKQET